MINAANQVERNEIANDHISLSQKFCSQEARSASSQNLREKLVALAGRQRELLACLSHQKEITAKLKKVLDQDNSSSLATESEIAVMSGCPVTDRPHLLDGRLLEAETSHMAGQGLLQRAQSHSVPVLAQQRPHLGLAEPVPLDTLIQHGFLQPGNGCLACTLMVCYASISLIRMESNAIYSVSPFV